MIAGQKVQTIRYGRRDYPIGEAVFEGSWTPAPIDIKELVYKTYKDLTEEDAELDGFESLKELQDTLLKFYPQIEADSELNLNI